MTPRSFDIPSTFEMPKTSLELENAIRARAYELYQERGGEPGRDVEDWLRAEEEIKELHATITAAKAMEMAATTQLRGRRSNGGGAFAAST